jgi:hypothetical protein
MDLEMLVRRQESGEFPSVPCSAAHTTVTQTTMNLHAETSPIWRR